MNDDEVVIIGAGICGLATALALHKKGIKSVVMERAESLRNVTGAAIGIRPNGWRALDQLGVAETLRRTAIPLQRNFRGVTLLVYGLILAAKFRELVRSRPEFPCNLRYALSSVESSLLDAPFTAEEVKDAVSGCARDKAPGPDGLSFNFI
ncbi:putative FAD-binding domain, FAD/NAD(P)-binding domain superfamily [Helianthus annuus]|nr:putative FAD-binding domain, FAD/NAD(P)-binding domain superfamily [Helianthus annuus]